MELKKTDILILGAGIAGISCAVKLARAGLKVCLAEKNERLGGRINELTSLYNSALLPADILKAKISGLQSSENIEVLFNTSLSVLTGEPGNFRAVLESAGEKKEVSCGAVVLAVGAELGMPQGLDVIPPDEKIISLSKYEKKRDNFLSKFKSEEGKKAVLFIGNYSNSYLPVLSASMFYNAALIAEINSSPVILAIPNAEVAREGVEELYREARDKGVILFKTSSSAPQIVKEGNKIIAFIEDPYLKNDGTKSSNSRVVVECGLVVVEDRVLPSAVKEELAEILRIKKHSRGSLQADNPNLTTVETNRYGIFLCGSCRQVSEIQEVERDAANVTAEVLHLLKGDLQYSSEKIIVDKGKCTLCLTCYRVCPHSAITWSRAAEISQISCMECGTCTSECPNRAIILTGYSDEDVYSAIEEIL